MFFFNDTKVTYKTRFNFHFFPQLFSHNGTADGAAFEQLIKYVNISEDLIGARICLHTDYHVYCAVHNTRFILPSTDWELQ